MLEDKIKMIQEGKNWSVDWDLVEELKPTIKHNEKIETTEHIDKQSWKDHPRYNEYEIICMVYNRVANRDEFLLWLHTKNTK